MPNGAQTGAGSRPGTDGGSGGGSGAAAAANEEYANRATQMVLDYLIRQREQPDPELLRELNWTQEDLRTFIDRWQAARDLANSPDPVDRQKWRQRLEQLGLGSSGPRAPLRGPELNDAFQRMLDAGSRIQPPELLRQRLEAFRRALDRQEDAN